jgi:hypothetical protein
MEHRVHPKQLELINAADRENCLRGLFLRSLGLTKTLARLDDPLDFQSVVAITRSLLELTVDMILVQHHDKSPNSAAKMHWWGESAKLKQAETTVNFYARCSQPVPDHHQFMVSFVQNSKGLVDTMRSGLWPAKDPTKSTPKHPNRWTGHDLLVDARAADRFEGRAIEKDLFMTLEEFYETEFRKMCWNVHGSGVVTVAGIPEEAFYITNGLGYKWCADLAMFCSQIILSDFGFAEHLCSLESEWDKIRQSRAVALANQVSHSPPSSQSAA